MLYYASVEIIVVIFSYILSLPFKYITHISVVRKNKTKIVNRKQNQIFFWTKYIGIPVVVLKMSCVKHCTLQKSHADRINSGWGSYEEN